MPRHHLHPEHAEALESEFDRRSATPAPTLKFDSPIADPRRIVATVPAAERHRLYVGRLVRVVGPGGAERKGCIEELRAERAVVRYIG